MILLNVASSSSNIIIYYSRDTSADNNERIQSTYTLNLTGNRLNTFINDYSTVNLADGDKILGDDKLYLKGTEGSMAVVELFKGMVDCDGDGTPETPAIDCFKNTYRVSDGNGGYKRDGAGNYLLKQLINEAQLIVYEDNTITTPSEDYHKYDRIYAYDIANSTSTIDYQYDPTENTSQPYYSRYISLGQRITTDGVSKYKIRLTEHLNNILIKDSTNTKIGLVLSSNVNIATNSEILNSADDVTAIPSTSIITPRGTILYGTNVSALNEDKKMRLEIFFTKPESN